MQEVLFKPTWLSIVFETKNKAYGAYILRQEYDRNRVLALLLTNGVLAGIFGIIWFTNGASITASKKKVDDTFIVHEFIDYKEEIKKDPVMVEPEVQKTKQLVKTIRSIELVVTQNPVSVEPVPTIDELGNDAIGSKTIEGVKTGFDELEHTGKVENAKIPSPAIPITAEIMPTFPEEFGTLNEYISKHIKYPRQASLSDIGGKVHIRFIVDEEGNIINLEVLKNIGYGLDEEALRVIKLMPKWNPGIQNGKPVKVQMVIPINFQLNN